MSDNYLGRGIVGGVLIDLHVTGQSWVSAAGRCWPVHPAADLALMRTPNMLAFDWHELKRFGIR